MKKTEAILVLALAILLPLAASLPLQAADRGAREAGDTWTGLFPSLDHAQYATLAAQARAEPWLYIANPYEAPSPDSPRNILALVLTAAGLLSALLGVSIPAALTGLGIVAIPLLVFAAWRLSSLLFTDALRRRVALLMLLLSGGLAFFVARITAFHPAAFDWPSDLRFWGGWTVFGSLHNPVWTVAILVFVTALALALAADRRPTPGRLAPLALVALLPIPVHPFTGAGCMAVLWLFAITGRHRLRLGLALLPGTVFAISHGLRLAQAGGASSGQHAMQWNTPSLALLVGGYGLLLPLALIGLLVVSRRPGPTRRLLLCWAGAGVALLFNPFIVGSKFGLVLQPCLALLSVEGLMALATYRSRVPRLMTAALLVLVLALGSATPQVLRFSVDYAGTVAESRLAPGEPRAMNVLRAAGPGLVLCAPEVGVRLPWLASRTPFLGHWFLTPDYRRRFEAAREAFREDTEPAARLAFLEEEGIRVVFLRHRDRHVLASVPPPPFVLAAHLGECDVYVR
jgi:hypothetical protein